MIALLLACVAPECAGVWVRLPDYIECVDRGTVVVCTDAYVCEEAG